MKERMEGRVWKGVASVAIKATKRRSATGNKTANKSMGVKPYLRGNHNTTSCARRGLPKGNQLAILLNRYERVCHGVKVVLV